MKQQLVFKKEYLMGFWADKPLPNDHNHLVVACFPKSGSTYLSSIVAQFPGMMRRDLVPGYERREQELSLENLIIFHDTDYVAQHHLKCSLPTIKALKIFSIHPVVLVRNLYDVVYSMVDYWQSGQIQSPIAFINNDITGADEDAKFHYFADMMAPWYLTFFVPWSSYNIPKTWLRYEDLIGGEVEAVKRIVADARMGIDDAAIETALSQAQQGETRLNKGVAGRGEALPQAVKDKIRRLADYYPSTDFSPIGL